MVNPARKTRRDRLAAAEQLLILLQDNYGDGLRAVGIYGSTGREEDLPYSDLEIMTVVDGIGVDRCHEFVVDGLKCEVDIVSEDVACSEIDDVELDWPVSVGVYVSAKPLYDPVGQFARLRTRFDQVVAQDFRSYIRDAYIGDIYEGICKFLNAAESGTPEQVRFLAFYLFDEMIKFVGLLNKTYYRSAATRPQQALGLPVSFPAFQQLGSLILQGRLEDVSALGEIGRRLFDETASYVAGLGIEVAEERLRVE